MFKTVLHRNRERGHVRLNWLDTHHSFSFGDYYDPNKMNFGALRVLNSDVITAGNGFSSHPHENIEIVTIVLDGVIAHKDSMGNTTHIHTDEIQLMSAGTGIEHSEFNPDSVNPVHLLQIWIYPDTENVQPRYQSISFSNDRDNELQQIVSPDLEDQGAWIYQQAWLARGRFTKKATIEYELHAVDMGVYVFIIKGQATIDGIKLMEQDALGVEGVSSFPIRIDKANTEILLIEVPI